MTLQLPRDLVQGPFGNKPEMALERAVSLTQGSQSDSLVVGSYMSRGYGIKLMSSSPWSPECLPGDLLGIVEGQSKALLGFML